MTDQNLNSLESLMKAYWKLKTSVDKMSTQQINSSPCSYIVGELIISMDL